MGKKFGIAAALCLQSVGADRKASVVEVVEGQDPFDVSGSGQARSVQPQLTGVEGTGAKWVANKFTKQPNRKLLGRVRFPVQTGIERCLET